MDEVSVGDVVAQFRIALGIIDETTISAKRAQEDAEHARAAYIEASRGTADRSMRMAVVDSRTAAEKAGKTARLLSEAADHLATYVNTIAPGTVPPRVSAPESLPEGAQIVADAVNRRDRASGLIHRAAKRTEDIKDATTTATKTVEDGTKTVLRQIKGVRPPPSSGHTSTSTALRPAPTQSVTAHEAVSAMAVAIVGAALVSKAVLHRIKGRPNRRPPDGNKK